MAIIPITVPLGSDLSQLKNSAKPVSNSILESGISDKFLLKETYQPNSDIIDSVKSINNETKQDNNDIFLA